MGNIKSKHSFIEIDFEYSIGVRIKECSLSAIMEAFCTILPKMVTDFVMKILLGYAEYVMKQEEKPFNCDNCGNTRAFIWKTRHGKPTQLLTIFRWVNLHQLQVQCSCCKHKFYITRKLLGLEPRKRIPAKTLRRLGLIGALTTFRVSKKILSIFGILIDKMTIWKAVQSMGKSIEFNLDTKEQNRGEADGTGKFI